MLNATNASNATKAATPTTKTAVAVNLQSSDSANKYTIIRKETTAKVLTFSMTFTSLEAGKSYSWMCEATSLSPTNPTFRTSMVKGTTQTNVDTTTGGSDSALWSSLFAAVLMIAAVFFY